MNLLGAVLSLSWLWAAAPADAAGAPIPEAKRVIADMATMIRGHVQWNNWPVWSAAMRPSWAENFTYDFIYPLGKTQGLWDWYKGEHLHYNWAFPNFKSNPFLTLGTNDSASIQSYHLVRWVGAFGGVPAPPDKPLIRIKDLDFYITGDGQIQYNWCMVDMVAILQQGGYDVLPPAPMPDGHVYLPPRAMDGIPAPFSPDVDPSIADKAMLVFRSMLTEDLVEQKPSARWWAEDVVWCGPAGIGMAKSREQYATHFLAPLHAAFSDPRIDMGRILCEGNYCGAHFHLVAKHTGTWLGQPATGKVVHLRIGTHARILLNGDVEGCGACGHIADGWAQLDVPAAFEQMGVDLLARAKRQAMAKYGLTAEAASFSPGHVSFSEIGPEPQSPTPQTDAAVSREFVGVVIGAALVGLLWALSELEGRRASAEQSAGLNANQPLLA